MGDVKMIKKKFFSCIILAVFAAVSLCAFAACDNGSGYDDSALVDRIEALEDQIKDQQDAINEQAETIKNQSAAITALQNSITELQTAKTKLENQITSLENDNTANKTEIETLKTKVEALEAANANFQQQIDALNTSSGTFAEDLAELTSNYNSLTASVQNAKFIERTVVTKEEVDAGHFLIRSCDLTVTKGFNHAVVGCTINYFEYAPIFQLVTCKVTVTENAQTSNAEVTLTRSSLNTSSKVISGSLVTNIEISDENSITADWLELVFYIFH